MTPIQQQKFKELTEAIYNKMKTCVALDETLRRYAKEIEEMELERKHLEAADE